MLALLCCTHALVPLAVSLPSSSPLATAPARAALAPSRHAVSHSTQMTVSNLGIFPSGVPSLTAPTSLLASEEKTLSEEDLEKREAARRVAWGVFIAGGAPSVFAQYSLVWSKEPKKKAEAKAEAAPAPAAVEWELVDRYGWELPAVAAACGHLEALELVLDAGCSANAQNAYSGRSALHRVADAGQVALLEMLLAKGGSVDVAAKDGATPLHIAAGHGHLDVVRALLEAGATVDLRDVCEQTPLLAATEAGHTPVVEALLDAGAALEACDENGLTPLHHACVGAKGKEAAAFGALAALLVSRGADPERKTRGERTCRRMQPSLFEAGGAVHTALQVLAEAKAKEEAEAEAEEEGAGE